MSKHFPVVLCVIVWAVIPGFMSLALHTNQGPQTCNAELPLGSLLGLETSGNAFDICLLNSTGNVVTNALSAVTNIVWFLQNSAFVLGNCFCRQDCIPPQIVCEDPNLLNLLTPPELEFNIVNGVAQFIYQAEMWLGFCFCPSLVAKGVDPCARPSNPQVCPL